MRHNTGMAYIFTSQDGSEWVIRAGTLNQARAAAHRFEKERTGSIAAGLIAARTVRVY